MTDDIRCVVCHRRQPSDGMTVCRTCLGRLDDDLARIVELTAMAAGWLNPRTGGGNGTRTVPGSRPPIDLASLDACLGNDVLPVLEEWERLTREHYGLGPYGPASEARTRALAAQQAQGGVIGPPATVKGCVGFLRAWLLRIAEDATYPVDDMAREVRDLRVGLEQLDPDRDRPGLRIPCPADNAEADGRSCGYRLVLTANLADDVYCPRCATTWTGNRLILVALNDPGVTVWAYPDVIEATLGVNATTLRQWHARGHVTRNGSRYDVGAAYRRKMGAA